jgi:hypothetical protein
MAQWDERYVRLASNYVHYPFTYSTSNTKIKVSIVVRNQKICVPASMGYHKKKYAAMILLAQLITIKDQFVLIRLGTRKIIKMKDYQV